jgi:diguanylate cyclase (GGDEF)-like protein/PAS domain S-box-containing protein
MERPTRLPFKSAQDKLNWVAEQLGKTDALDIIMNWGKDKIYFKDRQSRFFFISKGQGRSFSKKPTEDVVGSTDFDIFSDEHASQAYQDEQRIIRTGKPIIEIVEKETWPDGSHNWVSSSKYPLRDRNGRIIGTWGISRDVTELKRAEDELAKLNFQLKQANDKLAVLSETDSLSGLLNRRSLYDTLKRAYMLRSRARDKGYKAEFSLILFDIDNFKTINDTFGHLAGDAVIRHIADVLDESIRTTDTLFRYGGDEFLLLLPDTGLKAARFVAEKLLKKLLRRRCVFESKKIRLTASAGVSCSEETLKINELLKRSDRRLYASKKAGRNRAT